jgi:hypothetical protein
MHEYTGNIHLHTVHSDGHATHAEIAAAAGRAGLDFVIPTDHNVYVPGMDGWHGDTLLLVGEEIHDVDRDPEANHLLVLNVGEELAQYAHDPQALINAVNERDGLAFVAHPFEHSGAYANEPEINWVDWGVSGFTGLSIWNYMSEFKSHARNVASTLFAAYFPQAVVSGPYPETLCKWDELLRERRTPAICASDAHGTTYRLGPLGRVIFPYDFLLHTVNTHILTPEAFSGRLEHDASLVYEALGKGRAFMAYDFIGSAKGFRFGASSDKREITMGDELPLRGAVELEVTTPLPANIRLLCDGHSVAQARGRTLRYVTNQAGAYRVEVYRPYCLRSRGWIFGNALYVV